MLLVYRPESPLPETLKFLTSVLVHKDGSEQRIGLRTACRTEYNCRYIVEDGFDRDIFENALYGDQPDTWTIPAWPEPAFLGSAAAIGATSVTVDHSLCDFRAGQKAILYQDETKYEVLNTITTPGGSIGFSNALVNNWPAGTEILPLRDCFVVGAVPSQRYTSNATIYTFQFGVQDCMNLYTGSLPAGSTLSFATMGFGADSSVLVLSDPNAMGSQLPESTEAGITFIDAQTGAFTNFSYWLAARRTSSKGFAVHTRQDLWAVRVLLHALRGRVTAIFVPIFAKDLVPLAGITSGTATLAVANCGWTGYVQGKFRKYVRLELVDGTHLDNLVVSSVVNTSLQETLTFQNNWPATHTLADIARVTVYEKVRLDTDDITIMHHSSNGDATVQFPIKSVIE